MTISVRLDDDLERQLETLAQRKGVSKSALIRECLADYLSRPRHRVTAWELGKGLFGRVGSGHGQRARRTEQIVRERIGAQHRSGG